MWKVKSLLSNKWLRSQVKQKPVNELTAMDVMSSKALDSFDVEFPRDAFHIRSATNLIIAQAKEGTNVSTPSKDTKNINQTIMSEFGVRSR